MRPIEGKGGLRKQRRTVFFSYLDLPSFGETKANSDPSVEASDIFQEFLGAEEHISRCYSFLPRLEQVSRAYPFLLDSLPTITACTEASRSKSSSLLFILVW